MDIYIYPKIFEIIFKKEIKSYLKIVFFIVLIYSWPGVFLYPASENPSFILSGLAFLLVLNIIKEGVKLDKKNVIKSISIGVLLYGAYNIRPTYQGNLILILIMIFYFLIKKIDKKKYLSVLIMIMIGIVIAAIPQSIINKEIYNVYTPQNPLLLSTDFDRSTYLLYEGALWARYETIINKDADNSVMLSIDAVANEIFKQEGIDIGVVGNYTKLDFIKLVLKYPLEFLGIYTGHFVNSVDNRYGELYIDSIYSGRYLRVILNFLLYFFCFCGIICEMKNETKEHKFNLCNKEVYIKNREINNVICFVTHYGICIGYIIMPSIVSLAGHIEPRYVYSLYILVFTYLFFICNYRKVYQFIKDNVVTVLLIFIALFGACCYIWNTTLISSNFRDEVLEKEIVYKEGQEIYNEETITLSNSNDNLQVDQYKVDIEPNTRYRLSFELELNDDSPKLLYFDLMGQEYDNASQDFEFKYKKGSHKYVGEVNSGDSPKSVFFRTIYITNKEYILKDIQLVELEENGDE